MLVSLCQPKPEFVLNSPVGFSNTSISNLTLSILDEVVISTLLKKFKFLILKIRYHELAMKRLVFIIILNLSFTQVTNITQGETYASISEAVSQVNDQDIIEVGPQTYYERVIIWNPLTLIGLEGATINVSDQWSSGIIIKANDVTILVLGVYEIPTTIRLGKY